MTAADAEGPGHLGDAMSALLDGELDGAATDLARSHLAECPMCEAERTAISQARSWLRDLPALEPPAGFYDRVLASARADGIEGPRASSLADARARRRHGRRAGVAAMAACAAAIVAILNVAAPHEPSTSPPLGRFIQAHETQVGSGDPVTELATAVVPVGFRR